MNNPAGLETMRVVADLYWPWGFVVNLALIAFCWYKLAKIKKGGKNADI